jgi:hypothetical protein
MTSEMVLSLKRIREQLDEYQSLIDQRVSRWDPEFEVDDVKNVVAIIDEMLGEGEGQ